MVIGQSQGHGRVRGQGRGLCHVEDRDRPTLVDAVDDMDMLSMVPPDSVEAHPSEELSDHIHSSGVAPTAGSSTSVRRPRGKNKNLRFNAMINKDGPLTLEFNDKYRVPVGENVASWSRIISTIVWDHCDLHYDCWSKVPNVMVKNLEERVKGKFALDMGLKKHRDCLKYQLRLAYRRHRSDLHLDHYKIHFENVNSKDLAAVANAKLEARANVPEGISPEQWPLICDSFETVSWKEKSERNKKNRAEMQTNHTAGTSTFVNVIHKKAKITQSIPNHIEIYKETHVRKKDGKFVSDYAESKYDEMKSIDSSNSDNISQEDIVLKVLGGHRSGHVRGQGCGAIPIRSNFSSTQHHDECLAKQLETEKKLAESLEKCEKLEEMQATMQQSQAAMKAEMQEAQAAIKAEMQASQATLQAQVNMLLKHLGGLGANSHGSQASESNV